MPKSPTLTAYLARHATPDVGIVVASIAGVTADLAKHIARGKLDGGLDGGLGGEMGVSLATNADGDTQKALDVFADAAITDALMGTPVRWFASEEREDVMAMRASGSLAVAVDPLDGSSNIDLNVSIGTIFSIMPALEEGPASFLQPARAQVAAGYVVYGPQTMLVLTVGAGVAMFQLDPDSRLFHQIEAAVTVPPRANEFAINASNYRHWSRPIRAYVDDCLAGEDGPRGRNYNMRWIASLVADCHRILMRGGVFLYPADSRPGYERGRLRMVYECAPVAMLMAQCGGDASDGLNPYLDLVPERLHARTPFVFGSIEKVARVATYHRLPDSQSAPLFRKRGLFDIEGVNR